MVLEKKHCLVIVSILWGALSYSQTNRTAFPKVSNTKKAIDTFTLQNWVTVEENVEMSANGMYMMYVIYGRKDNSSTICFRSTDGKWKKAFTTSQPYQKFLTPNSHWGGVLINDSLFLQSLGSDRVQIISKVESIKSFNIRDSEWLAYKLKDSSHSLCLLNLLSGREFQFSDVKDFFLSGTSNNLLLKIEKRLGLHNSKALMLVDLKTSTSKTIWSSDIRSYNDVDCYGFTFDPREENLAFIVEDKRGQDISRALWIYKANSNRAFETVNDTTLKLGKNIILDNSSPSFCQSGRFIFFRVQESKSADSIDTNFAKVDVWSYKDEVLQSIQLSDRSKSVSSAAICVEGGHAILLDKPGDQIEVDPSFTHGDFVILSDQHLKESSFEEPTLDDKGRRTYWIVNLSDGSRKIILKESKASLGTLTTVSPNGRFIVYFNQKDTSYKSFQISTGVTRDISKGIHTRLDNKFTYLSGRLKQNTINPSGIGGWLSDSVTLLIYDNFDIWAIDAAGHKRPLNITTGYGRRNDIRLRLRPSWHYEPISKSEFQIIDGFDYKNKYTGFFRGFLTKAIDPVLLTMGPYKYAFIEPYNLRDSQKVKGDQIPGWVIGRESPSNPFNLYFTRDFKSYDTITKLRPQASYNWLSAELIKWREENGSLSEGVLYKPENFDQTQKYPLIFSCYEQSSENLFQFPYPSLCDAGMNIPWFVSRGYLVFVPDLSFRVGHVGESVTNTVISAAKYVSGLPWVDAKRLGLIGHSFGGYEIYYIITHSSIFASAAAAEGVTDLISSYGQLRGTNGLGSSNEWYFENGQGRIGATLWERPDLYIKGSPIFCANKVTTPLLMMNNKKDAPVSFDQGIEFFLALRRLGKKVWMLQYDGEGHILCNPKNEWDYTVRLSQFFDHYLKEASPAKWMTGGQP